MHPDGQDHAERHSHQSTGHRAGAHTGHGGDAEPRHVSVARGGETEARILEVRRFERADRGLGVALIPEKGQDGGGRHNIENA